MRKQILAVWLGLAWSACGSSSNNDDATAECKQSDDCTSGVCANGECQTATCGDGVVNQDSEDCDTSGESVSCDADCTAPPGCGDGIAEVGEFCQPTMLNLDIPSNSFTSGDFNGDNLLDLAVVKTDSDLVSIYLGSGTGAFQFGASYPVTEPDSIVAADFDEDGYLDLMVSRNHTDVIQPLWGSASGQMSASNAFSAGALSGDIYIAYLDNDSSIDVFNHNGLPLLNNADRTFQVNAPDQGIAAAAYISLTAPLGDFDSDGFMDRVASGNPVAVYPGTGSGGFASEARGCNNCSAPGAQTAVVADFTGDGDPDVAVGLLSGFSVHLGNGNPAPDSPFNYAEHFPGTSTFAIAAADINADGNQDLVTANEANDSVSVFLGQGNGLFEPAQTFSTLPARRPIWLRLADFNADGVLDIVVANETTEDMTIFVSNP